MARMILNYDVASLYPSLMVYYGYISRNIPSPDLFVETYHTRLEAKRTGDTEVSESLKLCLNTSYGAMLNQYNDLYDPLMARSVCITGQLVMSVLVQSYLDNLKTVRVIQTNTDGVLISLDSDEYPLLEKLNAKWEEDTQLTLEEERVRKVVQANVNNYLVVYDNGYVKVKGGHLSHGVAPAGAWNINNNYVIVKRAVIDYLAHGKPVEDTIMACDNILDFQFIARASGRYTHVYQIVDGEEVRVQKTNRVYATNEGKYGTLYKVHKETKRPAKIPDAPEHCLIDNENELEIGSIWKEFYVGKANNTIGFFKPKEESK